MFKPVSLFLALAISCSSCLSPADSKAREPKLTYLLDQAETELARRTAEGLETSARLFRQASSIAPDSARAWAGLAESSALVGLYGLVDPVEVMQEARSAADRALELDPENGLIHAVRGLVQYLHEWNWAKAETSFSKALEIDPSLVEAHHWAAMMFSATGRHEEALSQIQSAASLQPDSALLTVKVGTILANADRRVEARRALEGACSRFPSSVLAWNERGLLELREGQNDEAIICFSKALEIDGNSARALAGQAVARGRLGEKDAVSEIRRQLESAARKSYVSQTILAEVRLAEGSVSGALRALEEGYELRDPGLVYLLTRPGLTPLWQEARFRDLVLAIGLRTPMWNPEQGRLMAPPSGRATPFPIRPAG